MDRRRLLRPGLDTRAVERVFPKGTDKDIDSYSGFYDNGHRKATGLTEWLRERGVTRVTLAGLATDFCVKATALDAVKDGFDTTVWLEASRGIFPNVGSESETLSELPERRGSSRRRCLMEVRNQAILSEGMAVAFASGGWFRDPSQPAESELRIPTLQKWGVLRWKRPGDAERMPGGALRDDPDFLWEIVRASTVITHTDPKAVWGAWIHAEAAWHASKTSSPDGRLLLDTVKALLWTIRNLFSQPWSSSTDLPD
jgi:hypothetical protein